MSLIITNPANSPVVVSGGITIVSGTLSISGQSIYLVSGQNPVQAKITDADGLQAVHVDPVDDGIGTADIAFWTAAHMLGFDQVTNEMKRLRVTTSGQAGISGIPHKLVVDFSGSITKIGGDFFC